MALETYYTLLDVAVSATAAEIRRAYIRKAAECHPDKVATLDPEIQDLAKEKMLRLNEAYDVLRSPGERCRYDDYLRTLDPTFGRSGSEAPAPPQGPSPVDEERAAREEQERQRAAEAEERRKEADRQAAEEESRRAAEEKARQLRRLTPLLKFTTQALPVLDGSIRWRPSEDEYFDSIHRGTGKGVLRTYAYVKGFTSLDLESFAPLKSYATDLLGMAQGVLLKHYHSVIAVPAHVEDLEALRSAVRHFNVELLNLRPARKNVTVLVGFLDPEARAMFMPFSDQSVPDLSRLHIPR